MEQAIVKVQSALTSTHDNPEVLIYSRNRKWFWQGKSQEVFKLLGARMVKKYFHATLVNGKINLGTEVADPGW